MNKLAAAGFTPKRQRTQYTCMATSLSMCLEACGISASEDEVNKVMGAAPMQGASWEQAFGAAQHYGARVTFITPATLKQVKAWTDAGVAVMIAWNPEGRPWSHASVIKDVDDEFVYVADPNIPDPDETIRKVPKAEFYGKWYEKAADYLVRRCAMAVEREITPDGKQVVASMKTAKETVKVKVDPTRNPYERERGTRSWGAGSHGNRDRDVAEGRSRKDKHKKDWSEKEGNMTLNPIASRVAARYIQAFQFEFAQAFADQVGMPERVSLAKLTEILATNIQNIINEEEFTLDKLTPREGDVEISVGEIPGSYWDPPESIDHTFSYMEGADIDFTVTVSYKAIVNYLGLDHPFFRHKQRETLAFFTSPKNNRLITKFIQSMKDQFDVSGADLADFFADDLSDAFSDVSDRQLSGESFSFSPGGDNPIIKGIDVTLKGIAVHFSAYIETDTSDLQAEADYDGPDYDDRDDYYDRSWEP